MEGDEREVTIWSEGGLTVWATLDEGSLVITGADLDASELFGEDVTEYEYSITVAPDDVPTVLDQLDVAADLDVLDALVLRGPDLVRIGEAGWLESIGVPAAFRSRISSAQIIGENGEIEDVDGAGISEVTEVSGDSDPEDSEPK